MRRIALAVIAALGIVSLPVTSAQAEPSPAASVPVPAATPGQAVCTLDSQLSAITGLTATANGYAVVDRANTNNLSLRVYQINGSCQRTTPVSYTGVVNQARDPRDIQVSADGSTYWVADTGDDLRNPSRPSIGLWKLPVNGKSHGTLFRFAFPQGDGPYDGDALLMNGDGTPIFITHPLTGPAGIYVPAAAMNPSGGNVALKKVGQFTPQKTGTANTLGLAGQSTVTGGADSPDGKRVVLRTYSDAYEWDVTGGDVVKALTTGTPRITPLPNEPLGEAITYSHDGKNFLTVSDLDAGLKATVLRYTPAAAVAPVTKTASTAGGGNTNKADTRSWFSKLSFNQLTYLVAGVGVIGLLMVVGGVVGIMLARKRRVATAAQRTARRGDEPDWEDPQAQPVTALGAAPGGRYPRDGERYESDRYGGSTYSSGRGDLGPAGPGYAAEPGHAPEPGYPSGPGYPSRPGYNEPRVGRAEPPSPRGRPPAPNPPKSGGTYRSGRGAAAPEGGNYSGGSYSGGNYSGGTHDGGRPGGGYQPPPAAPASPPPAIPPQSRTDGGIARSHRPESRRAPRGNPAAPRRGYSEEHDGFDDLRRLTEED